MKLFRFLWTLSPKTVVLAAAAGIVSGLGSAALIALISCILQQTQAWSPAIVSIFIGVSLLILVCGIMSQFLLLHLSQGAIYNLRLQLSGKILSTPLPHLEELGSHRLLSTLTDDVLMLSFGLLSIPVIGVQMMIAAGCFIYLGWLSLKVLLLVITFLVMILTVYQLLASRALEKLGKAREHQDDIFKHFRALIDGVKELKMNAQRRRAFFDTLLEPTAEKSRRENFQGLSIYAGAIQVGYVMYFVLTGLILFISMQVLDMKREALIGSTLVLLYLRGPIEVIFGWLPEIGRAKIALAKIQDLGLMLGERTCHSRESGNPDRGRLDARFRGYDIDKKNVEQSNWQSLECQGVTYSYYHGDENRHFTLGPIDCAFQPGEIVFFAGGNGSGKSTFVKVLSGLYAPQNGRIRLDGQEINERNRQDYQQHFSVIFSDYFLFENLLGISQAHINIEAQSYLRQLQLQHKVQIQDGQFTTIQLSAGQRKRLALLTSYLDDRSIYVFDEWAADQDPVFKEIFYTRILPDLKNRGKTVVCITHDEKYFYVADRIFKLDYGQLVQESHDVPVKTNFFS